MIKYFTYNQGLNTMPDAPNKTVLKVIHNAGYFSNMTVRLMDIMAFMKEHGKFPDEVDSSEQFSFYKDEAHINLIPYYIQHIDESIPFKIPKEQKLDCMAFQFDDYRKLDFKTLKPLIDKYFTPGGYVMDKYNQLKQKYNLTDYCSVFYRGNDKQTETPTADYELFFSKCNEILNKEPNIVFLVQPDECNFLNEFRKRFKNVVAFTETPCIDNPNSMVSYTIPLGKRSEYGATYNAAVLLLSQGKHLVTHSGNGGLWSVLYRSNSENVYQSFNNKWYE
jgi:hypothetical protein